MRILRRLRGLRRFRMKQLPSHDVTGYVRPMRCLIAINNNRNNLRPNNRTRAMRLCD